MLSWSRGPAVAWLAFSLGVVAWPVPECAAQAERAGQRVSFTSYDGVDLRGVFYPGTGNRSACVLMIHAFGENSQKEGWDALAKKFSEKGFAVLTFDLRGHGESTGVSETFWQDTINQTLPSARSTKSKDRISYKDFRSVDHYLMMVNDVVAAKRFLDQKNDLQECNSSNVILVGAESGAALGAAYLKWASQNFRLKPGVFGQVVQGNEYEGRDIACAVWLTITESLGGSTKFSAQLTAWLKAVREKPMAFVYADKDTRGAALAKRLHDNVLRANTDKRLKHTVLLPVEGGRTLAGRGLLEARGLKTDDIILNYVTKVMNDRGTNVSVRRETDRIPARPVLVHTLR